jgi:phosphoserine phosphatase RsbU/P
MPILREIDTNREIVLQQPSLVIGRAGDCDVVLAEPRVSSRHAMVVRSGDDFILTDLGSTNGTLVNGHQVTASLRLNPGDRIDLSGCAFVFEQSPSAAGTSRAAFSLKDAVPDGKAAVMGSLEVTDTVRLEASPEAKLRAVLEFSRKLSNTLDMNALLPRILESLFAIFPQTDRGFILLRHPSTGQLQPRAVHRRQPQDVKPAISRTVIDHVLKTGQGILSADAGIDDRFDSSQSIQAQRIHSIMCVPLLSQSNELLGVIQIESQSMRRPYRQEDLDVFVSTSIQAARALELVRLHDELRDLEAATQIQKSFLPAERPKAPGLSFFDFYAPARQVGGDYYDYISLPGNRLAITLGDVSGKGVPAALLMARLSASARFCLATEPTVAGAVRKLNASMSQACGDGRFVTFVVAVIDLNSFKITLVNAGHIPPLRRHRAPPSVESLGDRSADIPLGVFERPYQEVELALDRGDTLVFYTDGVIEARNAGNELYGEERLREVIKSANPEAEPLGMAILADVRRFTGPIPLGDDLTIVCVGRAE